MTRLPNLRRLRVAQTALCVKASLFALDLARRCLAGAFAAHDAAVQRHRLATGPDLPAPPRRPDVPSVPPLVRDPRAGSGPNY